MPVRKHRKQRKIISQRVLLILAGCPTAFFSFEHPGFLERCNSSLDVYRVFDSRPIQLTHCFIGSHPQLQTKRSLLSLGTSPILAFRVSWEYSANALHSVPQTGRRWRGLSRRGTGVGAFTDEKTPLKLMGEMGRFRPSRMFSAVLPARSPRRGPLQKAGSRLFRRFANIFDRGFVRKDGGNGIYPADDCIAQFRA